MSEFPGIAGVKDFESVNIVDVDPRIYLRICSLQEAVFPGAKPLVIQFEYAGGSDTVEFINPDIKTTRCKEFINLSRLPRRNGFNLGNTLYSIPTKTDVSEQVSLCRIQRNPIDWL